MGQTVTINYRILSQTVTKRLKFNCENRTNRLTNKQSNIGIERRCMMNCTSNFTRCQNKIARLQGSQLSLSQHTGTISKDENDFFYETLIHSIGPTRSHFVRFARVLRFALTKILEKKSVSQSTQNDLKRLEMQKKKLPL